MGNTHSALVSKHWQGRERRLTLLVDEVSEAIIDCWQDLATSMFRSLVSLVIVNHDGSQGILVPSNPSPYSPSQFIPQVD